VLYIMLSVVMGKPLMHVLRERETHIRLNCGFVACFSPEGASE
jgi:hypothetical protein